jgi:hypothetical protein
LRQRHGRLGQALQPLHQRLGLLLLLLLRRLLLGRRLQAARAARLDGGAPPPDDRSPTAPARRRLRVLPLLGVLALAVLCLGLAADRGRLRKVGPQPAIEQLRERGALPRGPRAQPPAHHRLPAEVDVADIHDAGAGDRRGGGVDQRLDLEHHLDVIRHADAVAVGQRQDAVVVEHGVEVLDPDGVHRAVGHDPGVVRRLRVVELRPHGREHARGPLAAHGVHLAVHLLRPHGLRVEARLLVRHGGGRRQRRLQHVEDAALASHRRPDQHDAVAHERGLVQLAHLRHPVWVHHQPRNPHRQLQRLGHHVAAAAAAALRTVATAVHGAAGARGHAREQVRQQRQEERHILRHELGEVHVAERAVHQLALGGLEVGALDLAGGAQHGEDVAQAEVVVALVGQLLLGRGVQHEELLREPLVLVVPHRAQLDRHDHQPVRHHHRDRAEEALEVLRQLLAAGVARVHGDEEAAHGQQRDGAAVARELELRRAGLLGVLDREDLLRHHGEHRQLDAVELVEAAPQAALAQALEDLGAVGELLLVRAVGDHDVQPQRAPQVLDGLRFARAGRPGGRAAEAHAQRLRQRDVAAVRQRRDDEPLLAAQVLELVLEVHVRDRHHRLGGVPRAAASRVDLPAALGRVAVAVGPPVGAALLRPLEVPRPAQKALLEPIGQRLRHVTLVHVDRHERFDLRVLLRATEVLQAPAAEGVEHRLLPLPRLLHRRLLGAALAQRLLHGARPHQLHAPQRELRQRAVHELAPARLERLAQARVARAHLGRGLAAEAAERALHLGLQQREPDLDVARGRDGLVERHHLEAGPSARVHGGDLRAVLRRVRHEGDGVEDLLVGVRGVHGGRVGALREDQQQRRVGDEEEAREHAPLLLQVPLQRLLALLQLGVHDGQLVAQQLVRAAARHRAHGTTLQHDLAPVLVHLGELLRLERHLLGDVAAREDGHQRAPQQLHLEPALQSVPRVREHAQLVLALLLEGRDVPHGEHRLQVHLCLLELLQQGRRALQHEAVLRARRSVAAAVAAVLAVLAVLAARPVLPVLLAGGELLLLVPRLELEDLRRPDFLDLHQLELDLQLLLRPLRHLLHLVLELRQPRLDQRAELELRALDVEERAGDPHQLAPVARLHRGQAQLVHQRQQRLEGLDLGAQLEEGVPRAQLRRHAQAARRPRRHLLLHGRQLASYLHPQHVRPLLGLLQHLAVQAVQLVQERDLARRLAELGVLGRRHGEELLAAAEERHLARPDVGLLAEALEPRHRLGGCDGRHHRARRGELVPEVQHVRRELLDVLQQLPLEAALQPRQLVRLVLREVDQPLPLGLEHRAAVQLLLVDVPRRQEHLQQLVHVQHRVDLPVDAGLLLPDLRQHRHDVAQRVEVGGGPVEPVGGLAHVLVQGLHLRARLLVQVGRVLHLPLRALRLQLQLQVARVERQRADVVHRRDAGDALVHGVEALELGFVVRVAGPARNEAGVGSLLLVAPQPVVHLEGGEVVAHGAPHAQHGPREKQHHAHHGEVLGDAAEEREALLGRRGTLAPVVQPLGAAQHQHGGLVDGVLHVAERGREPHGGHRQLHVDLEEGALDEEEAAAAAAAHPLLERVQRLARAAEGGLEQQRVVVPHHALDVRLPHGRHVGAERVRRDEVDKVLHRELHLHVEPLQLLAHLHGVAALALEERLQREGRLRGKIHQLGLGHTKQVLLHAALRDVVDVGHDLLQLQQAGGDVQLEGVDVHGGPGQRLHAGPEARVQVAEVRAQQRQRHGQHAAAHALVLAQQVLQVVVVGLEAVLLQQHDARALRHLLPEPVQALGLADQLQDLLVEVDVQPPVHRVAHDERGGQAGLGLVHALHPGLVPQELEGHERACQLVVGADDALGVLGGEHVGVGLELFHGLLDAL